MNDPILQRLDRIIELLEQRSESRKEIDAMLQSALSNFAGPLPFEIGQPGGEIQLPNLHRVECAHAERAHVMMKELGEGLFEVTLECPGCGTSLSGIGQVESGG